MTPDPAEYIALQHAIAGQVGAAVMLALSFVEIGVIAITVAFGLRKTSMALMALYGFTSFWVPSPITMYVSPFIFVVSLAGLLYVFFFNGARKSLVQSKAEIK